MFQSLRAGIAEESERYINVLLILNILKNKRFRTEWAVLVSSLIFALSHFLNLFSAPPYQMTLNQVIYQAINAFGLGCFLAVLFLFSGKLWLTALVHTFYDVQGMSITTLGLVGDSVLSLFTQTGIVLILWIGLSTIIFHLNRKAIKKNAEIISTKYNSSETI